jgi:hypothetical protein
VRPAGWPAWLPHSKHFDDSDNILGRLLTDKRMERVWRRLLNPKQCPASANARTDAVALFLEEADDWTDQIAAVATFLYSARFYGPYRRTPAEIKASAEKVAEIPDVKIWKSVRAGGGTRDDADKLIEHKRHIAQRIGTRLKTETIAVIETATVAGHDGKLQAWRQPATLLRQVAAELRKLPVTDFELDERVAAIEEAADFIESRFATHTQASYASPLLVRRNHSDPHDRAYVLMLADVARRLFDKQMWDTLAIMATVALGKEVTKVRVRDWCKASVRTSAFLKRRIF